MNKFVKAAVAAGLLVAGAAANAATATTNFNVTASVSALCTVSATALAFGAYAPGANVDATSTVSVRCTRGTAYTVALGTGNAPSATITNRRMRSTATPANELNYTLFADAARTTNWGDTGATGAPTGTSTSFAAVNYTVYGRIPDATNQDAAVATDYTDTVAVTVTY